MPYKEIVELRKQIEELKAKSSNAGSNQLIESVNRLTQQMNSMMGLFKTAAEEMHLEEKDEHFVAKKIEPLIDKLDEIIEQNKTIAEGMVAVADIIKENIGGNIGKIKEAPRPFLRPEPTEFGPSFELPQPEIPDFPDIEQRKEPMPGQMPRHTPPRPMPNIPMPSQMSPSAFEEPFPFEEPKRKKGLFGRLKK